MQRSSTKLANLKIGVTTLLGLIIFFVFVVIIGMERNYFNETYQLRIKVNNVEGLSKGSLVSLGGLKIGNVKDIRFVHDQDGSSIDLAIEINAGYKSQITNKSSASFKTIGLLGDKFIDISMGSPEQTPLKDGDYLELKPSLTFENIAQKLEPAVNNLNSLLANLNDIAMNVKENESTIGRLVNDEQLGKKMNNTLDNINSFANAITNKESSIGKLAYSDELYKKLMVIARDLNEITRSINTGEGSLGKIIKEDSLYMNFNRLAKEIDNVVKKTKSDSTLVGAAINDRQLMININRIINKIDTLVDDFKANPGKYIDLSVF